jgi:uncharacterized protein YndB with AHSA1/START domain
MEAVEVERPIAAAPERVYDSWLDPDHARRWLFRTAEGILERCEIDARIGGGFTIVERRGSDLAEHFGEYVQLDRPRRLAFDFWTSFSTQRTRVTVTIAADGEGSLLTLRHDGVWADWQEKTRQGWTMILGGLAKALS